MPFDRVRSKVAVLPAAVLIVANVFGPSATAAQPTTPPSAAAADDAGAVLRDAAERGDLSAVDAALAAGSPVDSAGRHGGTALLAAARQGHLAVVTRLLERGADVNRRETFFHTSPLEVALGEGHLEVAHLLLAKGGESAVAALYTAIERGDVPLARAALASGRIEPLDLLSARLALRDLSAQAADQAGASAAKEPTDPALRAAQAELATLLANTTVERPTRPPYRPDPARLAAYPTKYRTRPGNGSPPSTLTLEMVGSNSVSVTEEGTKPLLLEAVAADRFESADGMIRLELAGRAQLIEWGELNRAGSSVALAPVTAPEAPELGGSPKQAATSDTPPATLTAPLATPTAATSVTAPAVAGASATSAPAAAGSSAGPAPTTSSSSRALTALSTAPRTSPRPWPMFRGAAASGIGDGQGAPASWNIAAGTNVRWKVPIPGLALSSPIVSGDRIYLTTAISGKGESTFRTGLYGDGTSVDDMSEHVFRLLALDAATGAVVWDREVFRGVPTVRRHLKSSLANATPATDGERIVVLFGTVGVLAAFDRTGKEVWRRDVSVLDANDPQSGSAEWGHAASPVLHDGLVLLQADRRRDSFLAAYRLSDGAPVWRVPRAEPSTWATPALLTVAGGNPPVELVTNGTTIRGYDPATGTELWRLGPNSEVVVATPVVSDGVAYVTAGYPPIRPVYAVRGGHRGDLTLADGTATSAAVVWSHQRGGTYLPSPLLYRDHLYTLNNNGLFTVYQAADGTEVYRARVGPAGTSFSASPVAADGRLYLASETGEVYVIAAAPDFTLLATNEMNEVVMATPAISDGQLLVRTLGHLVALAESPTPDQTTAAP